ncbi:hypothetical protein [Candidatus Phycorickettsia trachydisci]|nr:hypothetical protein [Candidatus Phycorickettsia trachydisci]
MIYDYLITNKFTANYEPDVMLAISELIKLVELNEVSKKIFKLKVINFERMTLFITSLSKSKIRETCKTVFLNLKKDIRESLPIHPGFCSIFLIHSDQWSFLIIKKEEGGSLRGIYNKPDGEILGSLKYSPLVGHKYSVRLDMPKIFAQLGIDVRNIGLKVSGITNADSGAVVISHLISSLFDPDRLLCNEFSSEDIVNLRITHAFVPCVIERLISINKTQDTQNLFLNFVNSQIKGSITEDLLRDLNGKLSSFGFAKTVLNIFKNATCHIDMAKDKEFYSKIDQLLIIIHNKIKQDIKAQQKKVSLHTKLYLQKNLNKQKSAKYIKKEMTTQIKDAFSEDYNVDDLLEYIWCQDTLGFKLYVKGLMEITGEKVEECNRWARVEIISSLCKLAFPSDRKVPLPTIFEIDEESDFGPWEQKEVDIKLPNLQLTGDEDVKLSAT